MKSVSARRRRLKWAETELYGTRFGHLLWQLWLRKCEVEFYPATDVENDAFGFNQSRKFVIVINRSAHVWPGETGANILKPDWVSLAVSLVVLLRPVDVMQRL